MGDTLPSHFKSSSGCSKKRGRKALSLCDSVIAYGKTDDVAIGDDACRAVKFEISVVELFVYPADKAVLMCEVDGV